MGAHQRYTQGSEGEGGYNIGPPGKYNPEQGTLVAILSENHWPPPPRFWQKSEGVPSPWILNRVHLFGSLLLCCVWFLLSSLVGYFFPPVFKPHVANPLCTTCFFQRKNSVSKLLWECPESFASNYGEARPIFLIGKISADRILASADTDTDTDTDSLTFRVRLQLSQLYKMLIYFEGQVLKPSTYERIGRMNKRRLDLLTSRLKLDFEPISQKNEKVLILQVRFANRCIVRLSSGGKT